MAVYLLSQTPDDPANARCLRFLQQATSQPQLLGPDDVESLTGADVLVVPAAETLSPEVQGQLWRRLRLGGVGQLWLAGQEFHLEGLPQQPAWHPAKDEHVRVASEILGEDRVLSINVLAGLTVSLGRSLALAEGTDHSVVWEYHPTSGAGHLILTTLDLLRHSPFTRERDRQQVFTALLDRLWDRARVSEVAAPSKVDEAPPELDDALLNTVLVVMVMLERQGEPLEADRVARVLQQRTTVAVTAEQLQRAFAWLSKQETSLKALISQRGLDAFARRLSREG